MKTWHAILKRKNQRIFALRNEVDRLYSENQRLLREIAEYETALTTLKKHMLENMQRKGGGMREEYGQKETV